jgi:Sec-independent protein translocase protein TatA
VPGLADLFTILAILVIVFGAAWMPRIGATIGKRLAGGKRDDAGR